MDKFYSSILLAKYQGYTAIDITNDNIKFTNVDIWYDDYAYVIIDDMFVYDRYGDKLREIQNHPLVTEVYPEIKITQEDDKITITVDETVRMYPLQRLLSQEIDSLVIHCNHIYIPTYVFNDIKANSLVLHKPILNNDILKSIHSCSVSIHSNDYHSFELLDCRIFKLYYTPNPNSAILPIMPKKAHDVELVLYTDGLFIDKLVFFGNESIQKLLIFFYAEHSIDIYLEKLPFLESLEVPDIMETGIFVPIETMRHLTEYIAPSNECFFLIKGNNICITEEMEDDDILSDIELPNLLIFNGTFSIDEQYLLLPNVKILTTSKILNSEYIPHDLEEYHIDYIDEPSREVSEFQEHLMNMPTIRKMPLILNPNVAVPFSDRHDIYYDIYIYKNMHYSTDVDQDTPGLQRALAHNERYLRKNKSLEYLAEIRYC